MTQFCWFNSVYRIKSSLFTRTTAHSLLYFKIHFIHIDQFTHKITIPLYEMCLLFTMHLILKL